MSRAPLPQGRSYSMMVREAIERAGRPLHRREIASAIRIALHKLTGNITNLVNRGYIVRVGDGMYDVGPKAPGLPRRRVEMSEDAQLLLWQLSHDREDGDPERDDAWIADYLDTDAQGARRVVDELSGLRHICRCGEGYQLTRRGRARVAWMEECEREKGAA